MEAKSVQKKERKGYLAPVLRISLRCSPHCVIVDALTPVNNSKTVQTITQCLKMSC